MHSFGKYDPGKTKHRLTFVTSVRVLIVSILLLIPFVSVHAQQQPTPIPSSNPSFVNDFNTLSQQVGVINAVMIVVVIFTFIVTLAGVRYILLPILQSSTQKDQAVIAASTQLANTNAQNIASQRDVADVLGKVVKHMDEMETRVEAEKRQQAIQDNSNAARDVINKHIDEAAKQVIGSVDEAVTPIQETVDNTLASVKSIEAKVETLMTKQEFTDELRPVRDDIAQLRKTIEERLLPIVPTSPPQPSAPIE